MKVTIEIVVSSIGEAANLENALRALAGPGSQLSRGVLPKGLTLKQQKGHLRHIGNACKVVSRLLRLPVYVAEL